MKMKTSLIALLTVPLATVGTLAAPTAEKTESDSMTVCNALGTPFPNAACQPFTLANGTTTAVFINNASKTKDKEFTTIIGMDTIGAALNKRIASSTTAWIPNQDSSEPLDYCDADKTIVSGHVNPNMPLVSDCLAVKEWAAANSGHWVVSKADMDEHTWTALLTVGTCAFVVGAPEGGRPGWGIAFGNNDVVETIQQAVEKNQINDRVEVAGRSPCSSWKEDGGWVKVAADWYIVNPAMIDWDN